MAVRERERILADEPVEAARSAGAWAWLMQRLTAVVLLVFLGAHFWALHFAAAGEHIRLEAVLERLKSPLFIIVDLGLLATAIYHALNGVRMVVFDFGLRPGARSAFTFILWIFGLAAFVYGLNTLHYLITGAPFFYL